MRGPESEFRNRYFITELFKHHLNRHPAFDLMRLDAVEVRDEFASFFKFDDDYCVGNLGGESGVINLVHNIETKHFAAAGNRDPARLGGVTL